MLKYKLNINNFVTDKQDIIPIRCKLENYVTKDGNFAIEYFNKKRMYMVVKDNIINKDHLRVIVNHRLMVVNESSVDKEKQTNLSLSSFTKEEDLKVLHVETSKDKIDNVFKEEFEDRNIVMLTFDVNRFYDLGRQRFLRIFDENTGKEKDGEYSIIFENYHFFTKNSSTVENNFLHFKYRARVKPLDEGAKPTTICRYFTEDGDEVVPYVNGEVTDEFFYAVIYVKVPLTYVNENILNITVDKENNGNVNSYDINSIINKDIGTFINYKNKPSSVLVYRETPYFNKLIDNFKASVYQPTNYLSIPLSETLSPNLLQSDVQQNFVRETKEKSINRIIEMEKDVYEPVIVSGSGDNEVIKNVKNIKFNLHFREHRGDSWTVDPNSYWNGTYLYSDENKKELILLDEEYIEKNKKKGFAKNISLNGANFFTKYDKFKRGKGKIKNYSSQSDLLSYLNFTDDDVRYQKSKLKKSFLRLSFYDSTNEADQNLLAYSTIFMPYGKLFGKYMKYGTFDSNDVEVKDGTYSQIQYSKGEADENVIVTSHKYIDNVKVNREFEYVVNGTMNGLTFTDSSGINIGLSENRIYRDGDSWFICYKDYDRSSLRLGVLKNAEMDNIDPEEFRLSSQFVIDDGRESKSSSEGFYLYLWKDNDGGIVPKDIYMKVEFNHAGYGRKVPFMMPYWDPEKDEKKGIKTFEEIVDDWNDENTKYGIRKYLKYSYIHFKHRYDSESNRHIYYLDNELYGDSIDLDSNDIVINLYEAKII